MVWAAKKPVSDPTIYPEKDRMGEGELQRLISELLRPMLARFLAERGVVSHVGANQFIYWVQFAPTRCIAPDLYVLPGIAQTRVEKVWKLWNELVVPSFCLEVVSGDYEKDYVTLPAACAEIGVPEVVIFDPEASAESDRVTWQVFRRKKPGGPLVQVLRTDRDVIRSEALGCWLAAVGRGAEQRVRIALDPGGRDLFPTELDLAVAARAGEQAAREELAAQRRAREALELELERLRAGQTVPRRAPQKPPKRR